MPGIEPIRVNSTDLRQRYKRRMFYQFGVESTRAPNFQPERFSVYCSGRPCQAGPLPEPTPLLGS
eukprot:7373888-Alexandrium_andersonii.AAC.1